MRAAVIVIFGGMCAFYEAVEINKHYCHMLLCTYERKHAHVCVCVLPTVVNIINFAVYSKIH